MNKTENKLLERAAHDASGIAPVNRHRLNGIEHRAAAYLHAENYGIYFTDASQPHFRLHPHVKRAVLARLQTKGGHQRVFEFIRLKR